MPDIWSGFRAFSIAGIKFNREGDADCRDRPENQTESSDDSNESEDDEDHRCYAKENMHRPTDPSRKSQCSVLLPPGPSVILRKPASSVNREAAGL